MAKKQTAAGQVFMAIMAMLFVIMSGTSLYKFYTLSKNGKSAQAQVLQYVPYVTHSRNGSTTHHAHILTYDGHTEKIELLRAVTPGANIQVVYMPEKPEVAAEGAPGASIKQLMGDSEFFSVIIMELIGLAILIAAIAGGPMKFGMKAGGNVNADKKAQDGAGANVSNDVNKTNITAVFSKTFRTLAKIPLRKTDNVLSKPNDFEAKNISIVKFGREAADAGYRIYMSGAENPEEALSMELGYLTKPQLRDLILSAALLDKAASKKTTKINLGAGTVEAAAHELSGEIPGYSEDTYIKALKAYSV
jgi:flagellar basal body-associated protein FliL